MLTFEQTFLPSSASSSSAASSSAAPVAHRWSPTVAKCCFDSPDPVHRLPDGSGLDDEFMDKHFADPILCDASRGLGMVMPHDSLRVRDVSSIIGPEYPVDVVDVRSGQSFSGWNLSDFAQYMDYPVSDRTAVLQVEQLDVAATPLSSHVAAPAVVRSTDWITRCWPRGPEVPAVPQCPHADAYMPRPTAPRTNQASLKTTPA